jgi:transcriptional regulator with XRE-family HTH domain
MEHSAIGRQLRGRRTAAGRTVASVAADAGLSVPYIANLENGRGNPTATALTRLAEALGMRLVITLVPDEDRQQAGGAASPPVPASLVRLGRTARFRQAVKAITTTLNLDTEEFSAQLVAALAALAGALGKDLAEPDWWRILDALLLIAAHPAAPQAPKPESPAVSRRARSAQIAGTIP